MQWMCSPLVHLLQIIQVGPIPCLLGCWHQSSSFACPELALQAPLGGILVVWCMVAYNYTTTYMLCRSEFLIVVVRCISLSRRHALLSQWDCAYTGQPAIGVLFMTGRCAHAPVTAAGMVNATPEILLLSLFSVGWVVRSVHMRLGALSHPR